MLFTFIVPAYNSQSHLRSCIDSILAQTYEDFEVIIINDGSTDDSEQIATEYAAKDSRVKVFSFSNSGVGMSRRRGIYLSNGDFLIFVDSDDTISSLLLEKINDFISINPSTEIIRFQCNIINDNTKKDHDRYNFECHGPLNGLDALKKYSIPDKKYAVYWLFCFSKSTFTQFLSIPNLKCYEDVALIPLLIAHSKSVATIGYRGYNYTYTNPYSLTNIRSIEAERSRAFDFFAAYDFAIQNFLKLDNISSSDIAFFINDYNRRLIGKFNSLDADLQAEFKTMLTSRVN